MEILISNRQEDETIDENFVKSLCKHVIDSENLQGEPEVSISFVTTGEISGLNSRYRGISAVTDVLSFAINEKDQELLVLGDVVICPNVASKNCQKENLELNDEIAILLTHGLLHLLGYTHESDEKADLMGQKERKILASFKRA